MAKPTRLTDGEPWSDCPAGEVGGLVDRLRQRQRRQQRRRVASGIACLGVLLVAGLYALPQMGSGEAGQTRIACDDVHQLAEKYLAGKLDVDLASRIDVHLQRCPPCRVIVDELREIQPQGADSVQSAGMDRSGILPGTGAGTGLVAVSLGSL